MSTEPLRVVEKSDALAEAAVPPPAAASAAPLGRQPVTIPLDVPIEAHGERLTAVTLRPLGVKDIEEVGEVAIDMFAPNRKVDARRVNDYIVRLAGIPRSSVLALDPGDWTQIMVQIVAFFFKQVPKS
jgi:Phage tail assembly chaperone proteins, E, or 41 or 14